MPRFVINKTGGNWPYNVIWIDPTKRDLDEVWKLSTFEAIELRDLLNRELPAAEVDADLATAREQLAALEASSRNLAEYALNNDGYRAPMSGNDIVTREEIRALRWGMEIAFAERAKAQRALIYLAREAGGSPVSGEPELDRHGEEIRAAIAKLREHAARIARLTEFVSTRLGAECAGFDSVDTAIAFMNRALQATGLTLHPTKTPDRNSADGSG